jgi:hypothetical protein
MIRNTSSRKDGTVECVSAFAEGHDGGTTSTGGVVRATHGRLGTVRGCVDLIREGDLVQDNLNREEM